MKTSSKIKEAERIEGILRGLLKLPENRRCINCNSLGPQYVCTTFLTFVCTNCSGVHREFTHRVKSVSMAKFSAEEVTSLQAAGNERARQIYLKGWDPQRNSYPDSSNLRRIREFIKHVYVDRKYTGEQSDRLPRLRLGEEEYNESRKVGAYLSEARSPPYESRYGHTSSARCYESRYGHSSRGRSNDRDFRCYHGERSRSHKRENSRSGGYRKSPVHFEIVDDRFRDDTFGSGRRDNSNREYKAHSRSPDYQSSSSSLEVRSIKEILGENAPPLEIAKRSKAIDGKDADSSANIQEIAPSVSPQHVDRNQVAPSGSPQHVDGNQVEQKNNNSESLINFGNDTEPMDAALAAPQTEEIIPSSDTGNQSSNEPSAKEKAPIAPKPNTLEFLLFELSGALVPQNNAEAPSSVPESNMPAGEQMSTLPSSVSSSATASSSNMPVQPSDGNMSEASNSSSAPVESMLMFPRSVDASTTALITYSPVQPSEANTPTVGASSAAPIGQLSLPSSSGASTTASTANVLMHPSGGNMPVSGVSPAPHLKQIKTSAQGIGDFPTVSTTVPVSPFQQSPLQVALDFNIESVAKDPNVQRLDSMQPSQPLSPLVADSRSSAAQQIATPVGALNNQPWKSSIVPYTQGPSVASAEQQSQTVLAVPDTSSTAAGRKELPADLFTASYMPPASVPQWQTGPYNAMGFNMHYYPNTMLAPPYSSQAKSTNPFDFNSDTATMPVQPFPSMASLQGGLPNLDLQPTSGIGAHSLLSMLPQSSSYASTIHQQSPSFPSPTSSSTFSGRQVHTNMTPPRLPGVDGFGSDRAVFGFSNIPQHPTAGYSVPTPANSFSSMGGNPFG